ncbi:hypothetical protein KY326_03455 [Candidatus Woesearchaeota archaeon]|nr:hypothetical protein [Candidatus Woesearchaeota archaeon]
MVGAYANRNTGNNRGGYQGGSSRGVSRRVEEREKKIAERLRQNDDAENSNKLFEVSCCNTGAVQRQVYRVTDRLGITNPYTRIKDFINTLETRIVDTLMESRTAETALKEAEEGFKEEELELKTLNADLEEAETIQKQYEDRLKELKDKRDKLIDEQLAIPKEKQYTDEWKTKEKELNDTIDEIDNLESDLEEHMDDIEGLQIDLIMTNNEYDAQDAIKITYKNRVIELKQAKYQLEYIKAVLSPYVNGAKETQTGLKNGLEQVKKDVKTGEQIIDVLGKIENSKTQDDPETTDYNPNLGKIEIKKPKELMRGDKSVLDHKVNEIREKMQKNRMRDRRQTT